MNSQVPTRTKGRALQTAPEVYVGTAALGCPVEQGSTVPLEAPAIQSQVNFARLDRPLAAVPP
jgi:hypothetical protein